MSSCKPVSTPLLEGVHLSVRMSPQDEGERKVMSRTPYRQIVGCILHLANTSRPDIAFAASYLSRYMQDPGISHWKAAKHVLRYLKGTRTLGIRYSRSTTGNRITGYADSDFAGDVDQRKSTSGFCFNFNGSAISWRGKKQTIVAQSTLEAEYIAMSFAVREALWIRNLLQEMKWKDKAIRIGDDNQRALRLSSDEIENERTKQIDVKFHFIRDHLERGTVAFDYVPTEDMIADIMTKALCQIKYSRFKTMMGMV